MAIASRDKETLSYVKELIERVFEDEPDEIWNQLCGCKTSYNNLTLATLASASLGDGGEFFEVVYKYIDEAANNVDERIQGGGAKDKMRNLFFPKPDETNEPADTPLVQSMISNDLALFRKVCEKFELVTGRDMTLTEIGNLIPEKFNFGDHGTYMSPNVFKVNIGDISKKMLIELFKAPIPGASLQSMKDYISDPSRLAYACWDHDLVTPLGDGLFRLRFKGQSIFSISIDMSVDVKFSASPNGNIQCKSVGYSIDDMARILGQGLLDTFSFELEGELRAQETEVRSLTLKNTLLNREVEITISYKIGMIARTKT